MNTTLFGYFAAVVQTQAKHLPKTSLAVGRLVRGVLNAKKKSSKTWYFQNSPRTAHAFTPVFPTMVYADSGWPVLLFFCFVPIAYFVSLCPMKHKHGYNQLQFPQPSLMLERCRQ